MKPKSLEDKYILRCLLTPGSAMVEESKRERHRDNEITKKERERGNKRD